MNKLRLEVQALLSRTETVRPAALRRSLREDCLYATDLPQVTDAESTAAFRRAAEEAGWLTAEENGWIQLDRIPAAPPEDGFPDFPGPEARCCESLLRRHAETEKRDGNREKRMLLKAREEGPEAYDKCCGKLHREWAENLRKREALPEIDLKYFTGDRNHADSAHRTRGIPD